MKSLSFLSACAACMLSLSNALGAIGDSQVANWKDNKTAAVVTQGGKAATVPAIQGAVQYDALPSGVVIELVPGTLVPGKTARGSLYKGKNS
jgi:hypothetical protein